MASLKISVITVVHLSTFVSHVTSILSGLELARLADLPSDALAEAQRVSYRLAELEESQHADSDASRVAVRRRVLLRVWMINYFFACSRSRRTR
jgi:hypothetical protein